MRLNLVAGRDTPEVCSTSGASAAASRSAGAASTARCPWASIIAGALRPPERKRPRFGVIEGGKKD